MSRIRRRKSPGWSKISIKRSTSLVPKFVKLVKLVNRKKIQILNPISRRKINLNGPTHEKLIKEKVLDTRGVDIRGVDIRGVNIRPKPKTQKKTKPSGDVIGNIMGFLPEKKMVEVSKFSKEYPGQNLLSYPFDLDNYEVCEAFSNSDFDILMKNQNIDRQGLFECVVMRGLVDKVKVLAKDKKVDPGLLNVVTFYSVGHRWNFYYVFSEKYVATFRLHHDSDMTWTIIKKFSGKEISSYNFSISTELKLGKKLENNLPLTEFNFLELILKKDVRVYGNYDPGTGISYHGVDFYKYDPERLELLEEEYIKEQKNIIRMDF